jgi:hypothetical protein
MRLKQVGDGRFSAANAAGEYDNAVRHLGGSSF